MRVQDNAYSLLKDMAISDFILYLGHDTAMKSLTTAWDSLDIVRQLIKLMISKSRIFSRSFSPVINKYYGTIIFLNSKLFPEYSNSKIKSMTF